MSRLMSAQSRFIAIVEAALLSALCGHCAPSYAHQGQAPPEAATTAVPDYYFDPADESAEATLLGNPRQYDADIAVSAGRSWFTWLAFTPGRGDHIWIGSEEGTNSHHRITPQHGEYARPTLTLDSMGRLWLSYEALDNGQWDLFAVPLQDGQAAAATQRISTGAAADVQHRVAADSQGGLWFVWQTDRGGQFDVVARRFANGALGERHLVGDHPAGDWHPSLAIDTKDTVYVVWDAYDGRSFNIHLRAFRGDRWGKIRDVAHSPALEVRPDVVVDHSSTVWIVWEEGGENWGLPFRGINTESLRDHHGPLHRFRLLRLAVLREDDSTGRLADPLPMPSVPLATHRAGRHAGMEKLGAFYERAKLSVDAAGRIWIAYRHYYTPWLGIAHRSHVEDGWGVYARSYGAGGWSKLYRMTIGQGDGMQRLELAPAGDAMAAVWTTGRTDRKPNERPRGVATAELAAAGEPSDVPVAGFVRIQPSRGALNSHEFGYIHGESVELSGKTYQLFYGDLHRHTDFSLCRVPVDGTLDDAYRYGIEVARLDFLGITDHSRDLALGDPQSQLWWRSRKEVGRHRLDGCFFPFFAYERSHNNTADHNVISLRGDMLRPHTYPVPTFWKELNHNTITIPHQPIRRDTWKYQDDKLRPLVEIFQGCRDHSIEEDVHRGLEHGYQLGFIASSDHMSTSASYACVWAEAASRESIFRALQSRRTFAATDKIRLVVHADGHWMGERITADSMPSITLEAHGTAPIRAVHLIVDGEHQETITPRDRHLKLNRQLDLVGRHYVYFHLEQSDGNEAWSSPLWFDIGSRKRDQ